MLFIYLLGFVRVHRQLKYEYQVDSIVRNCDISLKQGKWKRNVTRDGIYAKNSDSVYFIDICRENTARIELCKRTPAVCLQSNWWIGIKNK